MRTREVRQAIYEKLDEFANGEMYEYTQEIPDEVKAVPSTIYLWTVPHDEPKGDEFHTELRHGFRLGDLPDNTGMTPDLSVLIASRLVKAATVLLRRYGLEADV